MESERSWLQLSLWIIPCWTYSGPGCYSLPVEAVPGFFLLVQDSWPAAGSKVLAEAGLLLGKFQLLC